MYSNKFKSISLSVKNDNFYFLSLLC